jgi:hypothetical protein
LRAKVALAGIAGVGAAWLIPKGGTAPAPSPTPSTPSGLTAAEVPLASIPAGVSFRAIDGVRLFLVRSGESVVVLHARSTSADDGAVYWCPRASVFEDASGGAAWDRSGAAVSGAAAGSLERVSVVVAAGRVTIFPHVIRPGPAGPGSAPGGTVPACTASERVG